MFVQTLGRPADLLNPVFKIINLRALTEVTVFLIYECKRVGSSPCLKRQHMYCIFVQLLQR